jgi:hypothetical protein
MALGTWDTSVKVLGIPCSDNMKILGIQFTNTTSQSTLKCWTAVMDGIWAQARITYYRELSLCKRIQYVHTYLLARAWFTAQVFPSPNNCERQINTAITWFLPSTTRHPPTTEEVRRVGLDKCRSETPRITAPRTTDTEHIPSNPNSGLVSRVGHSDTRSRSATGPKDTNQVRIPSPVRDGRGLHLPTVGVGNV